MSMYGSGNTYHDLSGVMAGDRIRRLSIVELILQETGTYGDQYLRPYEAVCREDKLNALADRIMDNNRRSPGFRVEAPLLSGLTSGLVVPSSKIDTRIDIVNGWGERRFRFTLIVEEKTRLGSTIYHFHGYSEYFDVSYGDNIDPRMVFFMNDYMKIVRTDHGTHVSDRITDARTIINGRQMIQSMESPSGRILGLRPKDVYSGIQASHCSGDEGYGYSNLRDPRSDLSTAVTSSARRNTIPSVYLSTIVEKYRTSSVMAEVGTGLDNVYDKAMVQTYEPNMAEVEFLRKLADVRGMTTEPTDFTLEDLMKIDPSIANRVNYSPLEDLDSVSSVDAGYADWSARSIEAQIAATLAESVPALMLEVGLITFGFTCSNMTFGGQIEATPLFAGTVASGLQGSKIYNHFLNRFEIEIFPDISQQNELGLYVEVIADTTGEIAINVLVEGGSTEPYRFPCFANSLLSPTVTSENGRFKDFVSGVREILNYCGVEDEHHEDLIDTSELRETRTLAAGTAIDFADKLKSI